MEEVLEIKVEDLEVVWEAIWEVAILEAVEEILVAVGTKIKEAVCNLARHCIKVKFNLLKQMFTVFGMIKRLDKQPINIYYSVNNAVAVLMVFSSFDDQSNILKLNLFQVVTGEGETKEVLEVVMDLVAMEVVL